MTDIERQTPLNESSAPTYGCHLQPNSDIQSSSQTSQCKARCQGRCKSKFNLLSSICFGKFFNPFFKERTSEKMQFLFLSLLVISGKILKVTLFCNKPFRESKALFNWHQWLKKFYKITFWSVLTKKIFFKSFSLFLIYS